MDSLVHVRAMRQQRLTVALSVVQPFVPEQYH